MSVTALAGNSNREECFSDQINHLSKVECLAIRQLPTFNCFTTHCGRKFWITADSPSGGVQLVGLWFCAVVFFKGSCTKLFYCNCSFCCSPHTSMETTALIQTLNRGDVFFGSVYNSSLMQGRTSWYQHQFARYFPLLVAFA